MSKNLGKIKKIKIVYYSGTGGAQRVSQYLKKTFREARYEVCMQRLTSEMITDDGRYDLIVVVYAVHAFNAPEYVYKWIENSKKVEGIPAVVISVSGGGEVTPNTACRRSCIKRLERKGYEVVYEKMIVMPSNWIVPTKEPLALLLLEALPEKVKLIVKDITKGVRRRTEPLLIDRLFSRIGELEKIGAKFFGERIKVSETCNGCGWCSRNCPAGNIVMKRNKPQFGNRCHLCLACIYGCPSKALKPGFGNFIVVKEGYRLKELERKLPLLEDVNVKELTKGYLWSGVRKYLLDCDE